MHFLSRIRNVSLTLILLSGPCLLAQRKRVGGYYSLAVDKSFQGQGAGAGLLRDAVLRTVQAANIAGIRALLVHAISERAKRFYEAYGFISSPVEPMTVMIGLSEAEKILSGERRR